MTKQRETEALEGMMSDAAETLSAAEGVVHRVGPRRTVAWAVPTPTQAYAFVKILLSGWDGPRAIRYVLPEVSEARSVTLAGRWLQHRRVLEATVKLNGAVWPELEPEKRLHLALDKSYAELAYFLYSHRYAVLEGGDLKKYVHAQKVLTEKLAGTHGEESPYERAIRDILAQGGAVPVMSRATRPHGEAES